MNKDLHDTDDFFKSAYQQFEDTPSPGVWEKINAGLDKQAANDNKNKFLVWRRSAVVLLLLFTSFILFDSNILKTGSNHPVKNIRIASGTKSAHTAEPAAKVEIQEEKSSIDNSEGNNDFLRGKNEIASPNTNSISGEKNSGDKKTAGEKQRSANGQSAMPIAAATLDENTSLFLKKNESFQQEKISMVTLIEKGDPGNLPARLFDIEKLVPLSSTSIAVLKSSNKKIKKERRNNSFIPYWLLTAFGSYEGVNYKLDSDLPGNITSIKHSEVHEPSFSTGLLLTRRIKKYWGLQTGLIYSNNAIGVSPQKLYALQQPGGDIAYMYVTSSGYAYIKPGLGGPTAIGDTLNTIEGKHTLQFIRVPLMVKCSLGKNKFSINPGAGIEASFLTSAKVEIEIDRPPNSEVVFINKLNATKTVHFSLVADAELRYQASKKLSVNIRPSFRYAISPITENNVVETFPYSFGAGVGISFKF